MAFAPAAGETVLWHERRAPPYPQLVLVPALMAAIGAAAATGTATRIVLCAGALALAGLAWKVRGTGWIEDFALTDRRLVVSRPDGGSRSLQLAELRGATVQGARVSFAPVVGDRLVLGHVNRTASLLRALGTVAPDAVIDQRVETLCPT